MPDSHEALTSQLQARARLIGQVWAARLRETIVSEQRSACGGWPGTMSEARARVAVSLVPELPKSEQVQMTVQQREGAARLVYSSARSAWLQTRQPEPEEDV